MAAGLADTVCRRPPLALTFDRLTLKMVCESHLRWGTFLLTFGTLGLWVLELFAMYATDGRIKATLIAPSIRSGRNKSVLRMLSDTRRIRRLKLFGHVAWDDKSQDHSRALQACISPAPRNWRRRPGRLRHTWLRTVEEDLRQFNLGLASGLRRAQNRTAWRTLTGTAASPTSSD